MAIQETDCQPTVSKSADTNRRIRKPRNASSSAIGTVMTAPITLKSSQLVFHGSGAWLSAGGIPMSSPAVTTDSKPIYTTKTSTPDAIAIHPNRQSSIR